MSGNEEEDQPVAQSSRSPTRRLNPTDSIVITRVHTGRSSSAPPLPSSHKNPTPPGMVPSPALHHPPMQPAGALRPPNLTLPGPDLGPCPLTSSKTSTPLLFVPRTPSVPCLSGPWHGRYREIPGGSSSSLSLSHLGDAAECIVTTRSSLRVVPTLAAEAEEDKISEVGQACSNPAVLTRRHTFPRFEEYLDQSPEAQQERSQKGSPSEEASTVLTQETVPPERHPTSEAGSENVQGAYSLEKAVSSGEPVLVDVLLKRGAHPDGNADSQSPPLILAAASGWEKIVKMLLAAGASIDRRDGKNRTALHHAAAGGHRGVVKLLIVAGADLFAKSDEDFLPVQFTSDRRIQRLLTARMQGGNLSPREEAGLSDPDTFGSLSSSGSEALESPLRYSRVVHIEPRPERYDGWSFTHETQEKQLKKPVQCEATLQHCDEASCSSRQETTTQNEKQSKKSVKFIEDNLSYIRKDWHDAARSGCVGCGKEGCDGQCLPQPRPVQHDRRPEPVKSTGSFKWTRGELLGEGAYGKVFAGLNQSTGELMAVKQLKIDPGEGQERQTYLASLEREIDLYKKLRHKHIVGYIGMEKSESESSLYIFLEYVSGGSIQSMLERFGRFSEPLVRVYTRQLLLGLEYLHANKIVHRDIKGGNVLVDADGVVKLADFGASKAFQDPTITDGCRSIRGSVFWMAPEVIKGDGYGRRADIWSVGCTVIEMLTATHPWPGIDNTWTAIFHIAKASSGPPVPEDASQCSKDFLRHCFQLDARSRPTASQLLEHPFVSNMVDSLRCSFTPSSKN